MNQKLVVLIGSVAAFHLAVGGLFLAGGCAQEDPPMPPGIYVPKHGNALNTRQQDPAAADKAVGPESTLEVQETQKAENQKQPAAVVTPAPAAPAPAAPAEKEVKQNEGTAYKVVKGDSLWRLSRKFKVTIEDLATFNGLAANARLYIGQTLMIPAEGQKVKEASPKAKKFVRAKRVSKKSAVAKKTASKGKKSAVKSKRSVRRVAQPLPPDGIYTVKSGDNFTVIARRYGLRIADIQEANPNVNSSRLQIGQKLQLPAANSASKKAEKPADSKDILDPAAAPAVSGENKAAEQNKSAENADLTKLLDEASAPAADKKDTAAPAVDKNAPAAATPQKKDAAVSAADILSDDKNKFVLLDDGTSAIRLGVDMTVAEFCNKYTTNEEELNKVNPMLPFDGKLKAGLLIKIPEKKVPVK